MGIDFGTKRVGVALAPDGQQPQRLATLANDDNVLTAIGEIIRSQGGTIAVVGLPRNLEGEDTAQTAAVRRFAAALQQAQPSLRMVLQDEAVTSELAGQRLRAEGARNPGSLVDQEAAVIVVEDYLRGQ